MTRQASRFSGSAPSCGDLARVQHRARRLHHRPERTLGGALMASSTLATVTMSPGVETLGTRMASGATLGRRAQVVHAPGGLDGVDADDELAPPVAAALHGRADVVARRDLAFGRDGIFQVEDQRVGRKRLRLFQRALVGARHVEHAAARTDGHPRLPSCAAHNSARRAEDQDFRAQLAALRRAWRRRAAFGTVARMARVLALSSHVAFGSVGLAAIVPALQWLGHEVIVMPTVVLSNHPGYARFAGERDPGGADRRHARRAGGQRLARRHRGGDHRLSADAGACRRGALSRRARAPRQPGRALPVRSGVRRRAGRALSLRSHGRGHPRRAAAARQPRDAQPLRAVVAGRPAGRRRRRSAAGRVGARRSDGARHVDPGRATTASPTCSSPATTRIACFVRRRPSAPHGTGDLLAAMYLGNRLNGHSARLLPRRRRLGRRCQRRRQHGPG